jgi:hypothetical protein
VRLYLGAKSCGEALRLAPLLVSFGKYGTWTKERKECDKYKRQRKERKRERIIRKQECGKSTANPDLVVH